MKEEFALKHKVKWSACRQRHGEKKQPWPSVHGATWGPHFIWMGRGQEGGHRAGSPQLTIFVSSFCAHSTHTHIHTCGAMDFQLGPHQLCAWWNKHWQPLYICKGPCSSWACPTHTRPCAYKLTHAHTHSLWLRPSPSWGLQEEQTRHKMALAAPSCTQR